MICIDEFTANGINGLLFAHFGSEYTNDYLRKVISFITEKPLNRPLPIPGRGPNGYTGGPGRSDARKWLLSQRA
jgi:hypothetical protein